MPISLGFASKIKFSNENQFLVDFTAVCFLGAEDFSVSGNSNASRSCRTECAENATIALQVGAT